MWDASRRPAMSAKEAPQWERGRKGRSHGSSARSAARPAHASRAQESDYEPEPSEVLTSENFWLMAPPSACIAVIAASAISAASSAYSIRS